MGYAVFNVPEEKPPAFKVPEPQMKISQAELREKRIPMGHRGWCAHLVEAIQECKRKGMNGLNPYACMEEKEAYAWCQHVEYARRVLYVREKKAEIRAAAEASS